MKRNLLASLLLVGATTIGSAQSVTNWTGFYLGGNAGYAFGKSDVTTSTVFSPTGYFANSSVNSINATGADSVKPKGFTGGLTLGYNAQDGAAMYGFEMDLNAFSVKGDRSTTVVYPGFAPTTYTVNQTTKGGYLGTFRGRIGYAAGRSLWYGTAGLALASIKIEDSFSDTFATAAESASKSKTKAGWTLGGGYELDMQNQWSFKAEVLYVDLGKVSTSSSNLTAFTPAMAFPMNTFSHSANLKSEAIRFGFNYRF
ncbi:MAG TPA: outer membrane beta-barrel protein [Holophagaceae bacterium]|jgi:outer membrane immunogenic protein|nr:outer membrane beta-barrel protein [Holophagaceae bacterium]